MERAGGVDLVADGGGRRRGVAAEVVLRVVGEEREAAAGERDRLRVVAGGDVGDGAGRIGGGAAGDREVGRGEQRRVGAIEPAQHDRDQRRLPLLEAQLRDHRRPVGPAAAQQPLGGVGELRRQGGVGEVHDGHAACQALLDDPHALVHPHAAVAAAHDHGVVGDDAGEAAADVGEAGDHAVAGRGVLDGGELAARQRADLEQAARVDQLLDAAARRERAGRGGAGGLEVGVGALLGVRAGEAVGGACHGGNPFCC